jgi:hypothetical protein
MRIPLSLLMLLATTLRAQTPRIFYFPKPVAPTPYKAPMKPLTRLADLKAKHYGNTNWSELVIDDGNTRALVISAAPGSKVARHLFPDSPAWWVVQEGRIRFEIETPQGWQKFEAGDRLATYCVPSWCPRLGRTREVRSDRDQQCQCAARLGNETTRRSSQEAVLGPLGPSLARAPISKDQIDSLTGLASRVHERRMRGPYVDPVLDGFMPPQAPSVMMTPRVS